MEIQVTQEQVDAVIESIVRKEPFDQCDWSEDA